MESLAWTPYRLSLSCRGQQQTLGSKTMSSAWSATGLTTMSINIYEHIRLHFAQSRGHDTI